MPPPSPTRPLVSPRPDPALGPCVSIEVENLHKSFGAQQVLKGVTLEVQPGEIFVLMGPSGSGKSVLLRQLIGLDLPDAGDIRIGGLDASEPETHEKIVTALVFQAGALFNSISVYDNLALYLREHRLADEAEIKERVMGALEELGIGHAAKKLPAELSGGMKKRVAVARAIVMRPQVIFYDEPTSELDPVTAANVAELIAEVQAETGVTSLVVSHDKPLALGIADRIGLLWEGELIFTGSPQAFAQSSDPRVQAFLHPKIERPAQRTRPCDQLS